jgi:hypothetical protein
LSSLMGNILANKTYQDKMYGDKTYKNPKVSFTFQHHKVLATKHVGTKTYWGTKRFGSS